MHTRGFAWEEGVKEESKDMLGDAGFGETK